MSNFTSICSITSFFFCKHSVSLGEELRESQFAQCHPKEIKEGIIKCIMTSMTHSSTVPNKRHEIIIKLLIKEVKNSVGLLHHIQEVQVGIFGICRRNSWRDQTKWYLNIAQDSYCSQYWGEKLYYRKGQFLRHNRYGLHTGALPEVERWNRHSLEGRQDQTTTTWMIERNKNITIHNTFFFCISKQI